jgi:nitrite reductase/ring-hydroxylating ferredoxin subunit
MSPIDPSGSDPLWRDEFAVDAAHERYVTRRQFAKFLTLTSLAMLAGNLVILARSFGRPKPVTAERVIAREGDIPVGGVLVFHYPEEKDACLLIRTAPDAYVAYSQKCTHLSCAVFYDAERKRIECPCHHGFFSATDGSVLQGPPPRPLPRILIERRNGAIVAVGMAPGGEREA